MNEQKNRKNESSNLDFLRVCAVLTVYIAHLFQMFKIEYIGPISNNDFAQMGVLIFFVHTSLVLMMSMERLEWGGRTGAVDLCKTFYIRRAFRIYPLSLLAVAATAVFAIPSFPTRQYIWPGWFHFGSNLALTQNLTFSGSVLGPLWSLPYEIQMYLLLPLLYFLVKRWPYWWLPILLWLIALGLAPIQEYTIARLSLLQYAPCFLGGIAAYVLRSSRCLKLPFWGFPIAIAISYGIRGFGFKGGWIACLFLGILIPQFREFECQWLRTMTSWIARYSYGIYIVHVVAFWVSFVVLSWLAPTIQIIVCLLMSIGFPVILFHAIEKPMINVGVRLTRRFFP